MRLKLRIRKDKFGIHNLAGREGFEPPTAGLRGGLIDYKKLRKEFIEWLEMRIDKETVKKYVYHLDRFLTKPITSPTDVTNIIKNIDKRGVRRWFINAFRNLLKFLEYEKGWDETIINKYRKVAKTEKSGVREVFITSEELIEAYNNILPKYRTLFKLLVYSGMRLDQACEMLATFEHEKLVIKDDLGLARYPVASISKGYKRAYWAYMPLSFAKELDQIYINYGTAKKAVYYKRVSALSIRKWHLNFMIENGIPESVADFIQGRASVTVGSTHYLNKTKQADQFYSKVVDKFPI